MTQERSELIYRNKCLLAITDDEHSEENTLALAIVDQFGAFITALLEIT